MTLRSIIIDDEPLAHKVIQAYAKDVPGLEITGQCYLATEALAMLQTQEVDLIFLDIQMPKLTGLDFLRTLRHPPLVIITSAYQEYALESFELEVCDYLLKPFRFERFLQAVNKAVNWQRLRRASATTNVQSPESKESEFSKQDYLFVKSDKRLINIALSEIQYLESYGNYVKIWLAKEFVLTPRTLTSFVVELPAEHFYQIHKSYLIHRIFIAFVEGNMVKMRNGSTLPVGKHYRAGFRAFLGS